MARLGLLAFAVIWWIATPLPLAFTTLAMLAIGIATGALTVNARVRALQQLGALVRDRLVRHGDGARSDRRQPPLRAGLPRHDVGARPFRTAS